MFSSPELFRIGSLRYPTSQYSGREFIPVDCSQHDLHRKPQGIIILNESCRVSRADGSNTFEIATGGGKTYYLTADSQPIMEEWVRVLQNVVQRNALKLLLSQEDQKPTVQGWLVKVKHGHQKKCWCVLIGKMFIYFRTPNEQVKSRKSDLNHQCQ